MNTPRTLKPIQRRLGCHITINSQSKIDFSSNDTLSLSTEPELLDPFNTTQFNQFGSTGSRLLSGDYDTTHQLESKLATWLSKEHVLLFNSGFQLNSSIFKSLLTAKDALFIDKHCHASIIDGALASKATLYRYHHHNLDHLKQLLAQHRHHYNSVLLVTESLFSMDGTTSDIATLCALKHQFNTTLYIDDAHSIGLYGKNGQGLSHAYSQDIDYLIATFGKAFGSFGAFLACNQKTYTTMINHNRSLIYTTALPLPIIYWNDHALQWIKNHPNAHLPISKLATQFRNGLRKLNIPFTGTHHIISLVMPSSNKTVEISTQLQQSGYYVLPILPPTVPKNKSCIRFTITRAHTPKMIDDLLHCIATITHT